MLITVAFALLTVVLSANFESQRARKKQSTRNRVPIIQSFTSSTSRIDYCPFIPGEVCGPSGSRITLKVEADDPDNDQLTYKYSVSSGGIEGGGAIVTWNSDPKRLGTQTARVEVFDAQGAKSSSTLRVEFRPCGACDPPCSVVNVICPATVIEGDHVLFEATVSGNDLDRELLFLWRHSNGARIAGPAGPTLRIKANGLPGEIITATVRIKGVAPTCSSEASCSSKIRSGATKQ